MSNAALNHAWQNSKQTGGALVVMLAIADMANDEGDCWPGKTNLAKKCRMSERNLQRTLARLRDAGELVIFYNDGVVTGTGKTNRYHIVLQGVTPTSPPATRGDAHAAPGVTPTSPLTEQGVTPMPPPGVTPTSPDPSFDPSESPDPSFDPSPTTNTPVIEDSAVGVVDDDLELVLPEIRKLHLTQDAKDELLAKGAAYALAIAWAAQGPGARNPGGLAVSMMRGAGPPDEMLDLAKIAVEIGSADRAEVDRVLNQRQLEVLNGQARALAAVQESAESPVAAAVIPVAPDPLDEKPPDSRLTWRQVWSGAQSNLRMQLNTSTYQNYLARAQVVTVADGVMTIRVPSITAKDTLETRYREAVEERVRQLAGVAVTVAFVTDQVLIREMENAAGV